MLQNSDKSKYVYSGYVLDFDEAGSWSFDDFVSNDVISGVGNSSLVHTNNLKNKFLVLGEGPNDPSQHFNVGSTLFQLCGLTLI